jgi:hypothetical protein
MNARSNETGPRFLSWLEKKLCLKLSNFLHCQNHNRSQKKLCQNFIYKNTKTDFLYVVIYSFLNRMHLSRPLKALYNDFSYRFDRFWLVWLWRWIGNRRSFRLLVLIVLLDVVPYLLELEKLRLFVFTVIDLFKWSLRNLWKCASNWPAYANTRDFYKHQIFEQNFLIEIQNCFYHVLFRWLNGL